MTNAESVHIEAASTLAVIASSNAPLLFLDADLIVIAASRSFCDAFNIDQALVNQRLLMELGDGEWRSRQLASLLKATAAGHAEIQAYEMDLTRKGQKPRRLVLNAHKLDYGDTENVRLLLAVTDVTDVRAAEKVKDDLLREKAILLQEVQHRVANSLQIIASVLMQSARKMVSDEARGHLQNAHHRVISIAAVQQQLAASQLGDVTLRPYLTQLCASLGASMIQDTEQLTVEVKVDDSVINANASMSIGLIVTELVINALKHAFPGNRHGLIKVGFSSNGDGWNLHVSDNGIGMAKGSNASKPGLGTGIVEALSKQLQAEITTSDARPGTAILIAHKTDISDADTETLAA